MSTKLIAKWTAILSFTLLAAACGNSGDTSKPADAKDSAAKAASAPAGDIPEEKGLELIGKSDCTTCHRLHQAGEGPITGPAYSQVAAKYSPAADTTIDRLVKKIISGGSGVWGAIPMTPHPSLAPGDIREMVKYILTLKN